MALVIPRLDLQTLQVVPGTDLVFENTYLEYWLVGHGIVSREIYQAEYLPLSEGDRKELCRELEHRGLYLAFINGEKGYIVGRELYERMLNGSPDGKIRPILYGGQYSVHNASAYGSLIVSDGISSRTFGNAEKPVRALIVDDEAKSLSGFLGDLQVLEVLRRQFNTRLAKKVLTPDQLLQEIYARVGDGTLLISPRLAREFVPPTELHRIHQFRAGCLEYSGILKGTFQVSELCDYFNLDVVIGKNCIKMSDPELSKLGLKTFQSFWINRKMSSQETTQQVGPQVQNVLPFSTEREFNEKIFKEVRAFAKVAPTPLALAEDFLRVNQQNDENPLVRLLKNDEKRFLLSSTHVQNLLQAHLRGRWLFFATHGIEVPSAIAQPYRRVQPWEVANPQFPHGAILVYYRTPLVSGSALTVAINNLSLIPLKTELGDIEGVAYLPFWTAKEVAITDFDGDRNAFFFTHLTTSNLDVPRCLRSLFLSKDKTVFSQLGLQEQDLAVFDAVLSKPDNNNKAEEFYRAFLSFLKIQLEKETGLLKDADYPCVLREVIEIHENQAVFVNKAKKEKFVCGDRQHFETLWDVWSQLAENKIGIVSNNKMALDALSNECHYLANHGTISQVDQVHSEVTTRLRMLLAGNIKGVEIPSDEYLEERGFAFAEVKELRRQITSIIEQKDKRESLRQLSIFFKKVSNTLVATNQQIAVDGQKSAQVIDEKIHRFTSALEYKILNLIYDKNDTTLYKNGKVLEVNCYDPVSTRISTVNSFYTSFFKSYQDILGGGGWQGGSQGGSKKNPDVLITSAVRDFHEERWNQVKGDKLFNTIIQEYWLRLQPAHVLGKLEQSESNKESKQSHISVKFGESSFYFKPTQQIFKIEGEQITVANEKHPVSLIFEFRQLNDYSHNSYKESYGYLWVLQEVSGKGCYEEVGVSCSSNTLEGFQRQFSQLLGTNIPPEVLLQGSTFKFFVTPRPPSLCLEHEISISHFQKPISFNLKKERQYFAELARQYLLNMASELRQQSEERFSDFILYMASDTSSLTAALRLFPEDICQKVIQPMDRLVVSGLQYNEKSLQSLPAGIYEFQFGTYRYENKGQSRITKSLQIKTAEGGYQYYGAIAERSLILPEGTTVKAELYQANGGMRYLRLLDYQLPEREQVIDPKADSKGVILDILSVRHRLSAQFCFLIKPQDRRLEAELPPLVVPYSSDKILSLDSEKVVFRFVMDYLTKVRDCIQGYDRVVLNFGSHSLLRGGFLLKDASWQSFQEEIKNLSLPVDIQFTRPRFFKLEEYFRLQEQKRSCFRSSTGHIVQHSL